MAMPSTEKTNAPVCRLRQCVLLQACFLWTSFCLALWVLNGGIHIKQFQAPRPKPVPRNNNSSAISASDMGISDEEWERLQKIIEWPVPDQEITHLNQSTSPVHSSFSNNPSTISASDMGISDEEWKRLQKDIEWPGPDQEITHLDQSTSPVHSSFSIVGLKESYKVGEKISVAITARDHNKNLKRYGGDFFKAKLFNSELKASMYGEVVDHRNGTYSVDFLLPWEGQAQIFVRLEHSSEAVQIIKKYRDSSFPRTHFKGYFRSGKSRTREVVECNLKWGEDGSWKKGRCCCEYKDVRTGTVWQCQRPKKLSCDKLVYHSGGRMENPLNRFQQLFFSNKVTSVAIRGDTNITNILPNTAAIGTVEKCRSGLTTPVPAGFYLKDVWKSFVCNTRQFSPAQMGNCLKNKIVYLMGDSTTRQWFEYFEKIVPGIKTMDLHTHPGGGPLMAVQLENNTIIHWRVHGVPLRFSRVMPIIDLHYISNDIDEIAGGPHAVVVFTYCAHLVFHPITFYVFEVAKIRQSVLALLSRAPYTTVIIKSGNTTGRKSIFQSDWHVLQLNTVMREMFSDIDGVIFLDVWQMTSCHYLLENIHPGPVIIANEVDMLLSYVCPS
ncbi:NXPE family member 3-like isoform X2 [Labeo rohita]|uniref:NXPE family member 3-like isoform X2 n=1 Tax=Labeo rohita TaxID=84645 RepID=UPI0021E2AABE|nr:NXPE family member 3-like isoform X2 [Labeo rohita]